MNPEPHYVRVVNVGRRFGRGFNRLEGASPLQRVFAWTIALLVGVPLALLLGFLLLLAIGVALMFGVFSWLLGRPRGGAMTFSAAQTPRDAHGDSVPGRKNVKVVANER